MPTNKKEILAFCKEIASQHTGWQFVGGKFVNKISSEIHFIIDPCFTYRNGFMSFNVTGKVKLPKVLKLVNSICHIKGFTVQSSVSEQLNSVNLHRLIESCSFDLKGDVVISDDLIKQEINRWVQVASSYLEQTWPVDDLPTLFNAMQLSTSCYHGFYAKSLCCLAAYLGDFDFIDRYYAGELPHKSPVKITATDDNLLAVLPDWKSQWQATGKIKV